MNIYYSSNWMDELRSNSPNRKNLSPTSKVDQITGLLTNYQGAKYFVYNSTNLTLPHIRAKAKDPLDQPTWGNERWTRPFDRYASGELRFLEALESYQNPNVRTHNIAKADFVVVPIPLSAAVYWGNQSDVTEAFSHLFNNEPYFQGHPEKHVYFAIIEKLLRADKIGYFQHCCGVSSKIVSRIVPGILVKEFDPFSFLQYITDHKDEGWKVYDETQPVFHIVMKHRIQNPIFLLYLTMSGRKRIESFSIARRLGVHSTILHNTGMHCSVVT
jgi:hypothetical protein